MHGEKNNAYNDHIDQRLPQTEGDVETGYSYEVHSDQYRATNQNYIKKAILAFVSGALLICAMAHLVQYKNGLIVRKVIGKEGFDSTILDRYFGCNDDEPHRISSGDWIHKRSNPHHNSHGHHHHDNPHHGHPHHGHPHHDHPHDHRHLNHHTTR